MKRKAAGPDGWSSDFMLQLPDQAWDQLVSLVQQIEAKGQWPADLHHWKITFIPKTKSSGAVPTEALKVRPVSVVLSSIDVGLSLDSATLDGSWCKLCLPSKQEVCQA